MQNYLITRLIEGNTVYVNERELEDIKDFLLEKMSSKHDDLISEEDGDIFKCWMEKS